MDLLKQKKKWCVLDLKKKKTIGISKTREVEGRASAEGVETVNF